MNRRAIFSVTPDVLIGMCQSIEPFILQVIENPLPADAKIVGVNYNHERSVFDITLESCEFEEVPVGATIKFLPPTAFSRSTVPDTQEWYCPNDGASCEKWHDMGVKP